MKMKISVSILLSLIVTSRAQNKESCKAPKDAICLKQEDFESGTKIIDQPGDYKLCENIVFHPNGPEKGSEPSENAFDPDLSKYDPNSYGLGFFAAIAISASDVNLYLNCKSIKQSRGHALFQRFFAVIELANSPFIPNAGPANFVSDDDTFKPASNVLIQGPGSIGRSSHHGIHGNNNKDITIKNVEFKDFEVAAVALNNADTVLIKNCDLKRNRHDVPVLGSFSAARQIRPYGKILKDKEYSMNINGINKTASELYDNLIVSINNVYKDVVTEKDTTGGFIDPVKNPEEHYLFDNPKRVVDGPCYAIVIHGHGPAVGGFGFELDDDESLTSSNIKIINNDIKNVKCWTNEIPTAVVNGVIQNDVRGGILQFVSSFDGKALAINADGTYKGNVVADLQIMVAKAIKEEVLSTNSAELQSVSTIDDEIIDWASEEDAKYSPAYRCNGDSMYHVSKGMAILRIEDTIGFIIRDNNFKNIKNLSEKPFGSKFGKCTSFHSQTSVENLEVQQGANVRVISVAAVSAKKNSFNLIEENTIEKVSSKKADVVIGIDIQGKSERIKVDSNKVNLKQNAEEDTGDKFIAMRIRQFVHSKSIEVGYDNEFKQEIENSKIRRLGKKEREAMLLNAHKKNNGNEWQMGGCPFARKMQ